jgi:hypothetical protein
MRVPPHRPLSPADAQETFPIVRELLVRKKAVPVSRFQNQTQGAVLVDRNRVRIEMETSLVQAPISDFI